MSVDSCVVLQSLLGQIKRDGKVAGETHLLDAKYRNVWIECWTFVAIECRSSQNCRRVSTYHEMVSAKWKSTKHSRFLHTTYDIKYRYYISIPREQYWKRLWQCANYPYAWRELPEEHTQNMFLLGERFFDAVARHFLGSGAFKMGSFISIPMETHKSFELQAVYEGFIVQRLQRSISTFGILSLPQQDGRLWTLY